jgi:UDP-GlcNAc3NAcA epimerase
VKIVSIIGARPQFIKYAPLSQELKKSHRSVLIHTGQHYDINMSQVFFDELGIPAPDYNLGVGSGTHAYQTGAMLQGIEGILLQEKPDMAIIYGDTNSTLAGALSAAKLNLKLAHVEAGVRSFDKSIPEEINRLVADVCSNYLFCPTQTAVDNLKREGLTSGVFLTGDVMVDALNLSRNLAERSTVLEDLGLSSKKYLLVTVHRARNTDFRPNLESICQALIMLARQGETVIFPVHPRTKKLIEMYGLYDQLEEKIKIIEPQGYFEFIKLLSNARKVITDSGGIQKEAYILKVPCVSLNPTTPWVETVENGWNILVGTAKEKIVEAALTFKPNPHYTQTFGLGACRKIAAIIEEQINRKG